MPKHHFNMVEGLLYRTPLILEMKSPKDMSWDLGFHHANRGKPPEPNGSTVSDAEAYMAGYKHSRLKSGDEEGAPGGRSDRPEQDIEPSLTLPVHDVPESAKTLASVIAKARGRALVIGGAVRDKILGKSPKDWDVEVYGLDTENLIQVLETLGQVDAVGKQFGVLKIVIGDEHFDVSVPRREVKTGPGHKDYEVTPDPSMTIKEAARRRDFTMNTVAMDPHTGDVFDPYGGVDDLKAKILRATDPGVFVEDALRILRGAQFVARFGMTVDPQTMQLMQQAGPELPALARERVGEEWSKLLLKGVKPSTGMDVLKETGALRALHPALAAQSEGEEWEGLKGTVDRSIAITADVPELKVPVRFATVFHNTDPRGMAKMLYAELRVPKDMATRIERLVGEQANVGSEMSDSDIRHLSHRLGPKSSDDPTNASIEAFARLIGSVRGEEEGSQLLQRAQSLGVSNGRPPEILMGRHMGSLGIKPGPLLGKILKQVYTMQLNGEITDFAGAMTAARRIAGIPAEDPGLQRESLNLV